MWKTPTGKMDQRHESDSLKKRHYRAYSSLNLFDHASIYMFVHKCVYTNLCVCTCACVFVALDTSTQFEKTWCNRKELVLRWGKCVPTLTLLLSTCMFLGKCPPLSWVLLSSSVNEKVGLHGLWRYGCFIIFFLPGCSWWKMWKCMGCGIVKAGCRLHKQFQPY
jgi:hypothetical protein